MALLRQPAIAAALGSSLCAPPLKKVLLSCLDAHSQMLLTVRCSQ